MTTQPLTRQPAAVRSAIRAALAGAVQPRAALRCRRVRGRLVVADPATLRQWTVVDGQARPYRKSEWPSVVGERERRRAAGEAMRAASAVAHADALCDVVLERQARLLGEVAADLGINAQTTDERIEEIASRLLHSAEIEGYDAGVGLTTLAGHLRRAACAREAGR